MAWLSVGEDIGARTAQYHEDGSRTATRRWKLRNDTIVGMTKVFEAGGIPALLDVYDVDGVEDPDLKVRRLEPKQDENPYLWTLTAEYSNRLRNNRTRVDYAFETYSEGLQYDLQGNAIVTSAGQPYQPVQEVERGRLVMTFTRLESGFSPVFAKLFLWKLNATPFLGLPTRSCLMADIRARDTGEVIQQHEVSYVVKVADPYIADPPNRLPGFPGTLLGASGWDRRLLDQGSRQYNADASGWVQMFDDYGVAFENHALDGTGYQGDPFNPVYLTFQVYESADFSVLGLP